MVTCRLKRVLKRSGAVGRTVRLKRWRVANANQCGDAGFAADIDSCRLSRRRDERRDTMHGYVADIEELTEENTDFRRVLYSGGKLQLVLMSIGPGEEIGGEVHADTDQFFRIEAGKGRVVIEGVTHKIKAGDGIVVPAGAHHNVICTGHDPLKLYTIYGPPHHRDQFVQATKAEADASEEAFDGRATEKPADVVRA
jgi:mannose-6-phosphate isomerase-like protein (cupin superfamily)